jgi:hypothetical protein
VSGERVLENGDNGLDEQIRVLDRLASWPTNRSVRTNGRPQHSIIGLENIVHTDLGKTAEMILSL